MKKFNFKALLVLVLSFMLIFALTACEKDPEPPVEKEPTASEIFLEAMGGLDTTIASLADLTDTFDVDFDLYAIVNDTEYLISIKANLDISDNGNNNNNKIAIKVTENDERLIFGLYYNGAEKALFVDVPGHGISRYIDGIDLHDLATMATKEAGQLYYTSFIDFSLVEQAGSALSAAAEMLFEEDKYDIVKLGDKTIYTFYIAEELFDNTIPFALGLLGGNDGINDLLDMIFGTEGIKLNQVTIPPITATMVIINGPNGLEELKLLANVDAFTFKINREDPGKEIDALTFEAGLRINKIAPKGTEYAVLLEVPSISDDNHAYFSPLNIETSGTLVIDEDDVYVFDIKTDINPFKLKEAEIYVNILENDNTFLLIRTHEGTIYLEGSVLEGPIQVDVEDALDLIKDLFMNLDKITLPELGDIGDSVSSSDPDIMAALLLIPEAIKDNGLYADKKLIDNILKELDIVFEEMKDDIILEVVFELDEAEEKIIKVTGELWMANIVDPKAENIVHKDIEIFSLVIDITYDEDDDISLFTIVVTTKEDDEDPQSIYSGTLEILYTGTGEDKEFDGFEYNHTVTNPEGDKTIKVKLTGFTFSWGKEATIDKTGYDAINSGDYADGLEGVTALTIITDINEWIAKLFGSVDNDVV